MEKIGFTQILSVSKRPFKIKDNPEIMKACGPIRFSSQVVRAFKLKDLEDRHEDYNQTATYKGTIEEFPKELQFDKNMLFKKDVPMRVSGNYSTILTQTRFAPHFTVTNKQDHRGLFHPNKISSKNELETYEELDMNCCDDSKVNESQELQKI